MSLSFVGDTEGVEREYKSFEETVDPEVLVQALLREEDLSMLLVLRTGEKYSVYRIDDDEVEMVAVNTSLKMLGYIQHSNRFIRFDLVVQMGLPVDEEVFISDELTEEEIKAL